MFFKFFIDVLVKCFAIVFFFFCPYQGIDQIKNEVEDPSEPLIDGMHGHGR